MVVHVQEELDVSERKACRALGQPRSTQRRKPHVPDDEERLVKRIVELATRYGRYGYRRVTALLRREGWKVNGAEFTVKAGTSWLALMGAKTLCIEPGSPWENGYIKSFNGKPRDEPLNGEIFNTLLEANVLVERCRKEYNRFKPHSSLGYRPPASEAFEPKSVGLDLKAKKECLS